MTNADDVANTWEKGAKGGVIKANMQAYATRHASVTPNTSRDTILAHQAPSEPERVKS